MRQKRCFSVLVKNDTDAVTHIRTKRMNPMFFNLCLLLFCLGCFAFWCCPCFACVTSKKYGQCLCLPLLDIGCIPPITLAMRVSMRERYGIKVRPRFSAVALITCSRLHSVIFRQLFIFMKPKTNNLHSIFFKGRFLNYFTPEQILHGWNYTHVYH